MDYQALNTLITNEPSLADALAAGNGTAILTWLNAPSITASRPVPIDEFVAEMFRNGAFLAIQTAVLQGSATAILAFETIKNAKALGLQNIDMSLSANTSLLSALVSEGIMTEAQANDVAALASTLISPAEDAGLGVVAMDDVVRSLRGY